MNPEKLTAIELAYEGRNPFGVFTKAPKSMIEAMLENPKGCPLKVETNLGATVYIGLENLQYVIVSEFVPTEAPQEVTEV